MASKLVKLIKINGLQYNPNRDPQVYRRCVGEPFRLQALLDGEGEARCTLRDANGQILDEKTIARPGTYTHELSFPAPGVYIVTLTVESNGRRIAQDLRLDVLEHAWVG
jgi:hypothetical protein